METVLVTGASGLLGRAVIEQLAKTEKYHIVAVVSGRRNVSFPDGVQVEACDLLEECKRVELVNNIQPDILCHLAWGQENSDFRNAETNLLWLEVSLSLLRTFAQCGGHKVLFAGSSSEYDDTTGKMMEQYSPELMSVYGVCKKAFSEVMHDYCTRLGIQSIDARYFTIYGENDRHSFGAIPQAINRFLKNEQVVCKAPNTIRDYIYVEDAAKATAALLESEYVGSVNVSSGMPRSMRDVFTLIAYELGKEELLSFENEEQCSLILVGNNSVLRKVTGMESFMPFEEGMRKTIQWWKEHNL